MAARAGPPRFECPSDFSISPCCPGPPFSQEVLQSSSKQLWLIRAPASFSPESLSGHAVPLLGCQTLKVSQPDRTEKIFRIQTTLEAQGGAQLLVPSGHVDHFTCSPLFSGSLSICEKYRDPSGNQPLSPVVARTAPQIPEGLKQRFMPFGYQQKRLPLVRAAEEPPRKKKKKKHQLPEEEACEKQLPPLAMCLGEASEPSKAEAGDQHEQGAASWEPGSHTCPTAFAQEDLLSCKVEDLTPRNKKRKNKKKGKEGREVKQETEEAEGLLDSNSSKPQLWLATDPEPRAGEGSPLGMPEGAQHKHKGKKKEKSVPTEPISINDETAVVMLDDSGLEATLKGELVLAQEELGAGSSHHKAKKKRKKKEKEGREVKQEIEEAEGLLDSNSSKPQLWLATDPEPRAGEGGPLGMPEGAHHKHKGKRREKSLPTEPISVNEETAVVMLDDSGLKATLKDELVLAEEEPGAGSSHSKVKKKRKKKEKESPEETSQQQQGGPALQELDPPLVGGGAQEAEPGVEELSQRHKKKKAHHRREAAEEGLAWLKQEVGNS